MIIKKKRVLFTISIVLFPTIIIMNVTKNVWKIKHKRKDICVVIRIIVIIGEMEDNSRPFFKDGGEIYLLRADVTEQIIIEEQQFDH